MQNPIVPKPPEVMCERVRTYLKYCAVHIWCCPTSETTMARPPVFSRSRWMTNWGRSWPSLSYSSGHSWRHRSICASQPAVFFSST